MPYDDDDDLFGEEFDFVDDDDTDDDDSELEEKPKAKPTKKKPAAKDKAEKPARAPKRAARGEGKAEKPAAKREARREERSESEAGPKSPGPIPKLPPAKTPVDKAPVGYLSFAHGLDIDEDEDDPPFAEKPPTVAEVPAFAEPKAEDPAPAPAPPEPAGPPADHVVHIYEFGKLKRTIPRKFTDEQAVGFAEEFTRTNKAYGRYAVATPDDEEPSATFAGAAQR
ncbi:hypothetical protein [Lacipirellula limnantheis]|uniref:Uncharacterized protein n=1 Tax=Lacipirellula limnantheis TaxID=2528024 RepID=A0A517TS32_9BACT|nr:hypothetical protein [Lacipirellula limnantheis]QDT71182.1 hypothetical protein I41_03370 [Lacipirellula limnantheis]